MGLKINKGLKKRPVKMVVFGQEASGKSTLATNIGGNSLLLDCEDGSAYIDTNRVEIKTWAELCSAIMELGRDQHGMKTIIIDTADAAERMAVNYICDQHGKDSLEQFAYGKGQVYLGESWQKLMHACDDIAKHCNVIFICHSTVKRFSPPDEMDAYDRYEMRLAKHVLPLLKEWADAIAFLTFQQHVVTQQDGRKKVQGGQKRILHMERCAAYDAKCRLPGVPSSLPVDSAESLQPLKEALEF
jgi:hypothetical protein